MKLGLRINYRSKEHAVQREYSFNKAKELNYPQV